MAHTCSGPLHTAQTGCRRVENSFLKMQRGTMPSHVDFYFLAQQRFCMLRTGKVIYSQSHCHFPSRRHLHLCVHPEGTGAQQFIVCWTQRKSPSAALCNFPRLLFLPLPPSLCPRLVCSLPLALCIVQMFFAPPCHEQATSSV